ncbi:MAG: hypothetical protein PHC88_02770 [Terrimicrobiaceae bacterium]|nr:hypothetical protein [Terrimicrobiaceae bacterium]
MPEILHGTAPGFIPPFPGSVAKYLRPDSAFQRVHGKILPFVAWRDGRPVGRIAAIVNRSHNARYHDTTGFFGFFDCEDNAGTARALFDQAAAVLREQGLTSMRGPYSPSINDECGLLVWEAGKRGPCIGLTWNPSYYESLVLGAGFEQVRELLGFDLPMDRLEVPDRLKRLGDRAEKRARLHLRPINLKKLEKELEIVHEVYNDTLGRNWGFVPISMEDLLGAADDMRSFADPDIILIAEKDGEPAGVALTLPDFNQILAGLQRVPHWLRLPVILWRMKTRKITACRQMVYGVLPKFRDHGLHAWLLREQFSEAKKRYPFAELGWMEANNTPILAACAQVGGFHQRTWRIYEKPLPAAA